VATRAGYAFTGWWTAKTGGKKVVVGETVATEKASRTVWAHWTKTQTVKFDGNGGTCKTKSKKYTVGKTYASLPTATWKGHVFEGWTDSPEGGAEVAKGDAVTEEATRTLYAKWGAPRGVAEIAGIAVAAGGTGARRAAGAGEGGEGVCVLLVETVAGTEYEIQWTEALGGEWTTVARWVAEEDGECKLEVPVAAGAATGFFRVKGVGSEE
jgi:uncharacterized repeat protein (TIGR02543 family)